MILNVLLFKVFKYMNKFKYTIFSSLKIFNFIPAAAVLITAAGILYFSAASASAHDEYEFMFILKNGSSITASIDEKILSDEKITILKIQTLYGELEIPRGDIIKYYKSPKNKNSNIEHRKEPSESINDHDSKINDKNKYFEKNGGKTAPVPLNDEDISNDEHENNDGIENIEKISDVSTKNAADTLLNLDDDKLLDMLGESGVKPPVPIINDDIKKIEEIEDIRNKYQAKKDGRKKLIPDNLNSIESDIKDIAESSTEEDWLIAKFTKEIQIETAGTVPVEIIEVSDKNSNEIKLTAAGNDKKTEEAGINKKKSGEQITSETEEARIIGGGRLSEKIVTEFKKHKALPHKNVSEKQHLNAEIKKHFDDAAEIKSAADTKEVKIDTKEVKI